MKRLLLLMAIYVAAATGLSLRAENFSAGFNPLVQDTITIKLPDGVSMKVMVKNTDQLKNLQRYQLDSLMADEAYVKSLGFDTTTIMTMFIPNTYELYWNTSATERSGKRCATTSPSTSR